MANINPMGATGATFLPAQSNYFYNHPIYGKERTSYYWSSFYIKQELIAAKDNIEKVKHLFKSIIYDKAEDYLYFIKSEYPEYLQLLEEQKKLIVLR